MEGLREVAIRGNDSPEHTFFMGLAYLGGVDVEVEHSRALELICRAAEAGLPEAMEKLVSMYRTGEGVARDYQAAIGWQERLVAHRRARWEAGKSRDNAGKLFSTQWKLGDYWYELRRLEAAKAVYTGMLELCTEVGENWDFRRNLSISYGRLGGIAEAQGDLEAAKDYYAQDMKLAESLAAETGTVQARRDLSISYEKLGGIAEARGDLEAAKDYYEQCLKLAEALVAELRTIGSYDDYALSLFRMAAVSQNPAAQNEYLQQAHGIWSRLAELCPEVATYAQYRDFVKRYL